MSMTWFCALVIALAAAYMWGRANGLEEQGQLDGDRLLELKKYTYDKFYEHERWKEERKGGHDGIPHA